MIFASSRLVRRIFAGAAVALLLAAPAAARDRTRDLGQIPETGAEAAQSLHAREQGVISQLACGDEARFMAGLRAAPMERPLDNLMAKAAAFSGATSQAYECSIIQTFDLGEWNGNFAHESDITQSLPTPVPLGGPTVILADASWGALVDAINLLNDQIDKQGQVPDQDQRADGNAQEIQRLLNRIETTIYGAPCGNAVRSVSHVVRKPNADIHGHIEYSVAYGLTQQCLQQQVATLINAPDFQHLSNPGTGGLPCVFGLAGKVSGDADMGIMQLTRTTFLLRSGISKGVPLSDALRLAMDKLDTSLLTLSGEPATEVHSIAKCGNYDNQFGTARQRLDDTTFYDKDLQRDVSGKDEGSKGFKNFLGGFLLFVALVLAAVIIAWVAAAAAAILGPVLSVIALVGALTGAVVAEVPQLLTGVIFGGIQETENHLLMQNSSKYLMNKMLIEQLLSQNDDNGVDKYQGYNAKIDDWFISRLQRITENDFAEYNAKPYSRYSVGALYNIYDFSCEAGYRTVTAPTFPEKCSDTDHKLTTAAAIVLDLTAAKAALGSIQARRIVPFRRLAHVNTSFLLGRLDNGKRGEPYHLLDFGITADHMSAAIQLWTGMTDHGPMRQASSASLGEMIWDATSRYQPHPLILGIAIDKTRPYQQTLHHEGWERYSGGAGWLLTAGGSSSGYAQGFVGPLGTVYPSLFIKASDRGAGVPTTLIIASKPCAQSGCQTEQQAAAERQDVWANFIRFEGKREIWKTDGDDEPRTFDHNFCVSRSFACGINLQVPAALDKCLAPSAGVETASARSMRIGDSSDKLNCGLWDDANASNDFFVVLYSQPCAADGDACGRGEQWGFIEIVPRTLFTDRAALAKAIIDGNASNFAAMGHSGGKGTNTYHSVTMGTITFDAAGSFVRSVNGVATGDSASPNWPRARGDMINRLGAYHYTITNPQLGQTILLDFSNRENPLRVLPSAPPTPASAAVYVPDFGICLGCAAPPAAPPVK